jgi:hypothetical protein
MYSCVFERLSGNLVADVRPDDVQSEVTTMLADQHDAGRFVTGEAEQFYCVAADLSQWRCVVPAMAMLTHHNDLPQPLGLRRHQAQQFVNQVRRVWPPGPVDML